MKQTLSGLNRYAGAMSKSQAPESRHVVVRAAHAQDAAAVESVLLASYPSLMSGTYDSSLLAQALPRMTKPNPQLLGSGTYFLVEFEGRAVACGGWSLAAPGVSLSLPGVAHIGLIRMPKYGRLRPAGQTVISRQIHHAGLSVTGSLRKNRQGALRVQFR